MSLEEKEPIRGKEKRPEIVTVDQFEMWKFVEPGKIGETEALGPCIGVFLYDPENRYAFIGHFVDPRVGLKAMLVEAKKHYKDAGKIKVCVGGGVFQAEDAPDFKYDKYKRRYLEECLAKEGFKNIEYHYAESNEDTDMQIDTRTGKFKVEKRELDTWSGSED